MSVLGLSLAQFLFERAVQEVQGGVFVAKRWVELLQLVYGSGQHLDLSPQRRIDPLLFGKAVPTRNKRRKRSSEDFQFTHLLFLASSCFCSSVTLTFKSIIICWLSPLRLCISVSSSCFSISFFSRAWILAADARSPKPRPLRSFSFSTDKVRFSDLSCWFRSEIRWSVKAQNNVNSCLVHYYAF